MILYLNSILNVKYFKLYVHFNICILMLSTCKPQRKRGAGAYIQDISMFLNTNINPHTSDLTP